MTTSLWRPTIAVESATALMLVVAASVSLFQAPSLEAQDQRVDSFAQSVAPSAYSFTAVLAMGGASSASEARGVSVFALSPTYVGDASPAPTSDEVECHECQENEDEVTCDMVGKSPLSYCPAVHDACKLDPETTFATMHRFSFGGCGGGGGSGSAFAGWECRACGGESRCHGCWWDGPCHAECENGDPDLAYRIEQAIAVHDADQVARLVEEFAGVRMNVHASQIELATPCAAGPSITYRPLSWTFAVEVIEAAGHAVARTGAES